MLLPLVTLGVPHLHVIIPQLPSCLGGVTASSHWCAPLPLLLQRRHDKLFCVPRTYLQRNATQYAYGIYQGYVLAARSRSGRRILVWRPSWPFISVSDCMRREPQLATICSSDCMMRRLRAPDSPLSLRGWTILDHPAHQTACEGCGPPDSGVWATDSPLTPRRCWAILDHPGARAAAARVAAVVAAPHHRPGRGRLVLRARLRLVRHRHAHLRDAAGPSLLPLQYPIRSLQLRLSRLWSTPTPLRTCFSCVCLCFYCRACIHAPCMPPYVRPLHAYLSPAQVRLSFRSGTPLSTPIPFFPLQSPSTPCQLLLPRL